MSVRAADLPRTLLLENNKPFQLLLETLPYIAFVTVPGTNAAYYNQRLIDYVGFRPGPDRASRTALQHPDDQPVLEMARDAGVAANSEYIVEARVRRHDSVYRWHRIHNKPLIQEGRLIAWLGTAVDIHDIREANETLERHVRVRTAELEATNQRLTAEIERRQQTEQVLRESEARYRLLYNRTPVALQSVDANARLLDVNDTWLLMFGYAREEVIGCSPPDFMTPDSADRYRRQAWPEMLASGGLMRTVDYQFLTRSGDVFEGRLAARGEFTADGRFIRSWSAIVDVTAEKRAERTLRQAQRLDAVGQLAAGIAHDFNNLLTAVLGNLELLAKEIPRHESRTTAHIDRATQAARRGAALTTQLLAFSRQQRIASEPVDVNRVVRGMLSLLQGTIGPTIDIEMVAEPGVWTALADGSQLELAVMNLALNARDAMPEGGTITIRTGNVVRGNPLKPAEPEAGEYVFVAVADTGSGMPEDVQDKVFEPFFTTKPVGKGSGLGLPQVLGMAKQLGGGVVVASTPGAGSCLTLFLPRSRAVRPPETDTSVGSGTTEGAPGPACILLADDGGDARAVTDAML